jgi:hypothetical protein
MTASSPDGIEAEVHADHHVRFAAGAYRRYDARRWRTSSAG